jgi:site-specific DNA-methyltransferase (cytosine-N4-specific)
MQLISTLENIDIGLLKVWDKANKLFPEYTATQYSDLKAFIRLHGQPLPLVVSEDMRIVDGYNRYRLYKQAGVKTVSVQIYSYKNDAEMEIHGIALNAKRRHLDNVHCARAAKKLTVLYKPNPSETRNKLVQAGKKGGRGHKGSPSGDGDPFQKYLSASEKAAKAVGVSVNTVKMVSCVDATKDKFLIQSMEEGKISIAKAYELTFLSPAERKKHLTLTINESEKQLARATGMIKYLHGDCVDVMKTLKEKSVYCCVTSPPYWKVRDFGKGQIGLEDTADDYVKTMVNVFRAVRRVLKDEGTLWVNMGDSYAMNSTGSGLRNGKCCKDYSSKVRNSNSKINSRETSGCKNKDLIGIPWLLAFALRNDGWFLRCDIIWHKSRSAPENIKDRPARNHDYIFLLSKSKRYYYDYKSTMEKSKASEKYFFAKQESCLKKSVWTVNNEAFYEKHTASFPEKLIEPCILAGCPEHGWVLDPFAGSGTTGIVSQRLNRNCILIDINEKYVELQKERTKEQFYKTEKVDLAKVRKIIKQNEE